MLIYRAWLWSVSMIGFFNLHVFITSIDQSTLRRGRHGIGSLSEVLLESIASARGSA